MSEPLGSDLPECSGLLRSKWLRVSGPGGPDLLDSDYLVSKFKV